jgi:hypothetical protein
MYAAIATLGLSFLLTFFSVGVSEAAVWICSQPGGGTLFTDVPQTDGSCDKHEQVSQLNYAPPRNWANVPPPDATYERQAAIQLDPQPVTRDEEQYVAPSEAVADIGNFYGDNENSVFTQVYTYVPGFYGVPSLRHIQPRNFSDKPRPAHEVRHTGHLLPHVGSQTPFSHFEHSARTVAPGLPTHSAAPTLSRHARESSVAVASGAQLQSASTTPPHVQGNSVGGVAKAPPQSSSPTSSTHLREHSGDAGVHGAPPQSLGFRKDTKH